MPSSVASSFRGSVHAWLRRSLVALPVFCAAALAAPAARANPRPLPFTYIYETLPHGDAEVELYTDLTPQRLLDANGQAGWHLASQFQVEIEYGITDRLELGLYLTLQPVDLDFPGAPDLGEGNGVKQRLRYRFADSGVWPVDVAVYGELTENQREFEIEGKVILQRRVGPFRIAANLWAEREYTYRGEASWVLNPTAGVVFEKWFNVQPGIEYWMRGELEDGKFTVGPAHYLGPTAIVQFGKIWWSTGAYLQVNHVHAPTPVAGVEDTPFGPFWVRTIVGISY
ncbi:MAG TPA: hypothetical protein VHO67_13615 [Polyangia bacterium]|nr:hypothetical protein [Polyangia bacterium]